MIEVLLLDSTGAVVHVMVDGDTVEFEADTSNLPVAVKKGDVVVARFAHLLGWVRSGPEPADG